MRRQQLREILGNELSELPPTIQDQMQVIHDAWVECEAEAFRKELNNDR